MTPHGIKGKGREFQKEVAEMVAVSLDLTIEALSPLSVGAVKRGARYVAESAGPDLRVRMMGASGPDVLPLTEKAKQRFPFVVECKRRAVLPSWWDLFVRGGGEFARWAEQATAPIEKAKLAEAPLVAFRGDRTPVWCLFPVGRRDVSDALGLEHDGTMAVGQFRVSSSRPKRSYAMLPLAALLARLVRGPFPVGFVERPTCTCGCGLLVAWDSRRKAWGTLLAGHNRILPFEKPECARPDCAEKVASHSNRFCSNSCKQKALYSEGRHNMQRQEVRDKQAASLGMTVAARLADGKGWGSVPERYLRGAYISSKTGKREWYSSGYELRLFQVLDSWEEVVTWTKAHRVYIPYERDGKPAWYVPDVMASLSGGQQILFEVKPEYLLGDSIVVAKAKAARLWCRERGDVIYVFATEKNGWLDISGQPR